MEQSRSVPLPICLYNASEYFTSFKARISVYHGLCERAWEKAKFDWINSTNLEPKSMVTSHCFAQNFMSLMYPECLPEMLPTLTYWASIMNWADGTFRETDLQNYGGPIENGTIARNEQATNSGLQQLQAKAFLEIIATDKASGTQVLEDWTASKTGPNDTRLKPLTLADYMVVCVERSKTNVFWSLLAFAIGIRLTMEEAASLTKLRRLLSIFTAMLHDYFSWEKQPDFQIDSGSSRPVNALYIIMDSQSLDVEKARAELILEMKKIEWEYLQHKEYLLKQGLSVNIIKWLDNAELFVAGYNLWLRSDGDIGIPISLPVGVGLNRGEETASTLYRPLEQEVSQDVCLRSEPENVFYLTHGPYSLDEMPLVSPCTYIFSLRGSNIRSTILDALNVWYCVPKQKLDIINSSIDLLQHASLMLDDVEDGSPMRRGKPSTHVIFGFQQTVNSANLLCIKAMKMIRGISDQALFICIEELAQLFAGQGYDLYWTFHAQCPSEEEYIRSADGKTGGLFRILSELMRSGATKNANLSLVELVTLMGRYYQVLNDYQNLASTISTNRKGFCEDLDEGKLSLPLVHGLNSTTDRVLLQSILEQRKRQNKLTVGLKELVLEKLKEAGSLAYTEQVLRRLHQAIKERIQQAESKTGTENWVLKLLVFRLMI